MKKPVYIRCPRCELNYIQKKDKLCPVCKADLASKDEYVDDMDLELCPICRTNYIQADEIMCANCLKEHQNEDGELNDDWEDYITRDEEDDVITEDDETGGIATVTDLTESSLLDDDLAPDIDFGDDDKALEKIYQKQMMTKKRKMKTMMKSLAMMTLKMMMTRLKVTMN